MQLIAYGAQDIYLTGNPQITFFKVVYRRHTNFSMESISQTPQGGTTTLQGNDKITANINRNGDLVSGLHLEITMENLSSSYANPTSAWIGEHTIELGGQIIDRQTGSWLETWAELTQPNPTGAVAGSINCSGVAGGDSVDSRNSLNTLFQRTTGMGGVSVLVSASNTIEKIALNSGSYFYIPLQFWFCRNPGLALPLIALQYHEVKFTMERNPDVFKNSRGQFNIYADYIYLDTDERRRFAQVSHEYLIEQLQHFETALTNTYDLNFNHPVKELIWTGKWSYGNNKPLFNKSNETNETWQLLLNGNDRFSPRHTTYFTKYQILQYHTGPGGLNASDSHVNSFDDSIAVYSFSLKPEEHQPSGTCNFSRLDNAKLVNLGGPSEGQILEIYAVNYNILRIMSGMGGLAYSN